MAGVSSPSTPRLEAAAIRRSTSFPSVDAGLLAAVRPTGVRFAGIFFRGVLTFQLGQ
jgi:hypothetical protein